MQKIISINDETRELIVSLEPDPRRYEWKEINGKRNLYDKLDNVYIPEEVFHKSAETLRGQPIYFEPRKIYNIETYINSRLSAIENMLTNPINSSVLGDKSESFLQSLSVNKLEFVILSLDIVSSTELSITMPEEKFNRLIQVTLYELGEVVPKFHGFVLKYTGDGFIAYFPAPSFITKNDLAIDCAITLKDMVYNALNPIFERMCYPIIDIKIGIDAGEAYVETIGSPETKQYKEIMGKVINLSVKIQEQADLGDIYIGETVEHNLHTMWRKICEPIDLGEKWKYKKVNNEIYRVYKIKLGERNKLWDSS